MLIAHLGCFPLDHWVSENRILIATQLQKTPLSVPRSRITPKFFLVGCTGSTLLQKTQTLVPTVATSGGPSPMPVTQDHGSGT